MPFQRTDSPQEKRSSEQLYLLHPPQPGREQLRLAGTEGLARSWRLLIRFRSTLFAACLAGLIAAGVLTALQRPKFKAISTIEVQSVNVDFMNARRLSPVSEDSAANLLTDLQTQTKSIESKDLVEKTLSKLRNAGKLSAVQQELAKPGPLRRLLHKPAPSPSEIRLALLDGTLDHLTVREVGQTRVLEISFVSTDPVFAANFVNALISEYMESRIEARLSRSQRTGEWLSRELKDVRDKLERSERDMENYAHVSGLLFTSSALTNLKETNVSEEKLRLVQDSLAKASADLATARARHDIATTAPPETLSEVLNDDPLRDLQSKLTSLRQNQAELNRIYASKSDKVQRVAAQIETLETEVLKERAQIVSRIENEFHAAEERQRLLQADYDRQVRVVASDGEKSIRYNSLKREADTNRELYLSMLEQMKEATVASAVRASSAQVIDFASIPEFPSSPSYPINLALGVVLSSILSGAFILVRESSNNSLRAPGDVELLTALPELGVIPRASSNNESLQELLHPNLRKGAVSASDYRRSLFADSFRSIITSIIVAGENDARPRVLVIVSPNCGDGKTTVVSGIAIALAELNQRVLLIDGDLRSSRIHKVFGLENKTGLSSLLDVPYSAKAFREAVQATKIPGLEALVSGPLQASSSNSLYHPQLRELIDGARPQYDMILIDTPPTMLVSDARLIARAADAVVLVARSAKTTSEAALASCKRFVDDRTFILGTVLNDWSPPKSHISGYPRPDRPQKNALVLYRSDSLTEVG